MRPTNRGVCIRPAWPAETESFLHGPKRAGWKEATQYASGSCAPCEHRSGADTPYIATTQETLATCSSRGSHGPKYSRDGSCASSYMRPPGYRWGLSSSVRNIRVEQTRGSSSPHACCSDTAPQYEGLCVERICSF